MQLLDSFQMNLFVLAFIVQFPWKLSSVVQLKQKLSSTTLHIMRYFEMRFKSKIQIVSWKWERGTMRTEIRSRNPTDIPKACSSCLTNDKSNYSHLVSRILAPLHLSHRLHVINRRLSYSNITTIIATVFRKLMMYNCIGRMYCH